jgi:hypothetical protein
MGAANRQVPTGAVFSPVSTPASAIATLAWFTLAIFLVVGGLLAYSIVPFRARPGDEPREPAQLYGSTNSRPRFPRGCALGNSSIAMKRAGALAAGIESRGISNEQVGQIRPSAARHFPQNFLPARF